MEPTTLNLVQPDAVARAFNAGRFSEVEELCKEVLSQAPDTAWAWHFLGRLPGLDTESALDFLGTALSLSSNNVQILCDLSRVHARSDQFKLALERAQQAIALQPNSATTLIALAEAYSLAGQLDLAWPLWERAARLASSSFQAQFAFGQGLFERGQAKNAIKYLNRASSLSPQNLEPIFLLGKCYAAIGKYDIALKAFIRAKEINPQEAWVWFEAALCLLASGNLTEALNWTKGAIRIDQGQILFHELIAECYFLRKDYISSFESILCASRLGVISSKSHFIWANMYQYRKELAAALHHYAEAIKLEPNNLVYLHNYGSLCIDIGHLAIALEVFDNILSLAPDSVPVLLNKAIILRGVCRGREALALMDKAMRLNERPGAVKFNLIGRGDPISINYLYTHLYVVDLDPEIIFDRHRAWGSKQSKINPPAFNHTPSGGGEGKRKLKIGYISSDLRSHAVAAFMCPVFKNHDFSEFDVYVYSGSVNCDFVSDWIKSRVTLWQDVSSLSDRDIANLIYSDKIDILVDLSGHTEGNFLNVFAFKPAPIQVSYLGYPCTTGLKTIDYRLTDAWTDPIGTSEHLYTEKLLRIPDSAWCFGPVSSARVLNDLPPVCNKGYITFVCLNNLAKINDILIELWVRILKQVPNSCIVFKHRNFSDPEIVQQFIKPFTLAGIDPHRLQLRLWEPSTEGHLAVYNQTDIALDCFPYNGTTTTCEALSCGVPVISLVGSTHVSRVGLSLLTNVGLSELATTTTDEYVSTAIRLAGDLNRLKELRVSLPQRMQNSVLGDGRGFTQKLEDIYRHMFISYPKKR
ncbi:MAG: tetratricopeptide repeat protein [Opitutaceae bacterium]